MKKFFYTILALLLFLNFSYGQENKGVKKDEAEAMKTQLEAAGAKVELK